MGLVETGVWRWNEREKAESWDESRVERKEDEQSLRERAVIYNYYHSPAASSVAVEDDSVDIAPRAPCFNYLFTVESRIPGY
jgi:hypothetical protein